MIVPRSRKLGLSLLIRLTLLSLRGLELDRNRKYQRDGTLEHVLRLISLRETGYVYEGPRLRTLSSLAGSGTSRRGESSQSSYTWRRYPTEVVESLR
jgi:hypothetical protein